MRPVFEDAECIQMRAAIELPNGDHVELTTWEPVPSYKTIDLINESRRSAWEVKAAKMQDDKKIWSRGATPTSYLLNHALTRAEWSYCYVIVGYRVDGEDVTDMCILSNVPAHEYLKGPWRTQWQAGREPLPN